MEGWRVQGWLGYGVGIYGMQGSKVHERGGEKIVINNEVRSGKKVVFLHPEV